MIMHEGVLCYISQDTLLADFIDIKHDNLMATDWEIVPAEDDQKLNEWNGA